ncbi:hypothetical protein LUZ60_000734 [Juncus effusus]|nr:hypothetical protein LUZ60_000734 [Juncus effusus]
MEAPLLSHSSIEIQETSVPTISSSSSTTRHILIRLAAILVIASACIVATHLTSDSFEISIINSTHDNPIVARFNLMFVSNGKISEILYNQNQLIEQALYPNDSFPKKPLTHVSIHLLSHNTSTQLMVEPGVKTGEFSIMLNPNVISSENPHKALQTVLHRAMAHVRVWNGPKEVVSAIVEYLAVQVSSKEITTPTKSYTSCWSSRFLRFYERRVNGFVARLNKRNRDQYELSSYTSLCEDYMASLTSPTMAPYQST